MTDTKSRKVAYLALSEVYGGNDAGFVHTHSIVSFLKKAGVDVTLFIGRTKKDICPDVDAIFVTLPRLSNIFRVNPLSYLNSFSVMRQKLDGVDIIHERFHINPIDLLFLGRKKYVLEVNDPAIELCSGLKKILYMLLVRMKYNRADAIIVQTETLKRIVSKHTDTSVYVIPNGVDTSIFRPDVKCDVRRKYGISKSDALVTFVGSFREWHGVLDVVEMAKRIPSAKFLLVGNGVLFDEVKKASLGVSNVILSGAVDYREIPGIMANSDVLIAPFNTMGFKQLDVCGFFWCPVKLFEYMASGKPVVSYDFPEVKKILGKGGLLARQGDVDDFLNVLDRLLKNPNFRRNLGHDAHDLAKMEYGWNKRAQEVMCVYERVMRTG